MKTDRHECMHPCPSCARHVRSYEAACPFCEAQLPGKCTLPDAPPAGRASSRAALLFAAGAAVAAMACGKTSGGGGGCNPMPVAKYGPAPIHLEDDAGPKEPGPTDSGPTDSGAG